MTDKYLSLDPVRTRTGLEARLVHLGGCVQVGKEFDMTRAQDDCQATGKPLRQALEVTTTSKMEGT